MRRVINTRLLNKSCLVRVESDRKTYCSRCGRPVPCDSYSYKNHMEKFHGLSTQDLSLVGPFHAIPEHSCAWGITAIKGVLHFQVYELKMLLNEQYPYGYSRGAWILKYDAVLMNGKITQKGNTNVSLEYWLEKAFSRETSNNRSLNSCTALEAVHSLYPNVNSLDAASCLRMFKDGFVIQPDYEDWDDELDAIYSNEQKYLKGEYDAYMRYLQKGEEGFLMIIVPSHDRIRIETVILISRNYLFSDRVLHIPDLLKIRFKSICVIDEALIRFKEKYPDMMLDRYKGEHPFLPLLGKYISPVYELLYKASLSAITDCMVEIPEKDEVRIDLSATNLKKAFGLPIHILRKLDQKGDVFWKVLPPLQDLYKYSPGLADAFPYYTYELSRFLSEEVWEMKDGNWRLPLLDMYGPQDDRKLLRIARYINNTAEKNPDMDVYTLYRDYITSARIVEVEKLDLTPSNLKEFHNHMALLAYEKRNHEQSEAYSAALENPVYSQLTTDGGEEEKEEKKTAKPSKYVIIKPRSAADVVLEGEAMHNCVRLYIRRCIEGKTHILFLRERKAPEKSLVTIEVSPYGNRLKLVQAKAFANRRPNEDIARFIREWAKKKHVIIDTYDV